MTTEQRPDWNRLSGATKPCDYHEIIDGIEVTCIGGKLSFDGRLHVPHTECAAGQISFFGPETGVQVACPYDTATIYLPQQRWDNAVAN